VYCLPNFQNPSGVTLSYARRERLIDISRQHGLPLVEDDPYRDLRFEGVHLPRLIDLDAARDPNGTSYRGNAISIGTFSKILAPGLRVAWVIAAPEVIAHLVLAKQGTDLHTPTLNQMIAYELLRTGFLEQHLEVIVGTYRERRDVMLAALERHFPAGTRWTHPEGGMFLWVELPEGVDASALLEEAVEQRVAFVPGVDFHADGSGRNTLRLNFSNSSPDLIREGIARLGRAAHRIMLETPRTPEGIPAENSA
jgi:2-aminoadipate transaminase